MVVPGLPAGLFQQSMRAMALRTLEPVSDLLVRLMNGLEIAEKVRSHAVEPAWKRAVDERIAVSARPARLLAGILTVEARSAAWLHELAMRRPQLIESINREMGGDFIREIRLKLGGGFPPLRSLAVAASAVTASDAAIQQACEELQKSGADEGARLAARARALQLAARARKP